MAKQKKNSKISLSEFRAWLSGVEEMQEDNWSPSKTQWDTIRRKMDSIVEDETVEAQPASHPQQQPVHYAQPQQPQHVPQSSMGPVGPVAAPVDINARGGVGNGLTADIDTSSGSYESSFT